MSRPGSPSSSTSGSYIIAEEAGIGIDGEIVTGPPAQEGPQKSSSQANDATPGLGKQSHQSSSQHLTPIARSDGNIIMREPDDEDEHEHVQGKHSAAKLTEPSSPGFEDYDEALDYMDEDPGPGNVVPPPLAYIQQATGTYTHQTESFGL